MTTATKAQVFYCTEFVRWPAPEIGNNRYKGKPTPVCWMEFPTAEARAVHYREAHADFLNACTDAHRAWMLEGTEIQFTPSDRPMPKPTQAEAALVTDIENDGEYHPPTGTKTDNSASDKQIALIASLSERKGVEVNECRTRQEASIEIERLMAFPDKGLRPNRFAGMCSECAAPVAAEEGFTRKVDDAWVVAHKPGECPADAVKPVVVPDGYYAVEADAGHLSFYRVKAGRKPGIIFVDLLVGGGVNGSLTPQKVSYRNIPPVLAKIAVDPHGAMELFGQSVGKCGRCHRGLSDQESRERGIGPECWSKMN